MFHFAASEFKHDGDKEEEARVQGLSKAFDHVRHLPPPGPASVINLEIRTHEHT